MASGDCWLNVTEVHKNSNKMGEERQQRENVPLRVPALLKFHFFHWVQILVYFIFAKVFEGIVIAFNTLLIKLTLKEIFFVSFDFNELLLFLFNSMEHSQTSESFLFQVLYQEKQVRIYTVCGSGQWRFAIFCLCFVFVTGSSNIQGPQCRKPHQHHDCQANHRPQ